MRESTEVIQPALWDLGITPRWERPRAWYVRIADLPGFIRRVAPVLEAKLPGLSLTTGYLPLTTDHFRNPLEPII